MTVLESPKSVKERLEIKVKEKMRIEEERAKSLDEQRAAAQLRDSTRSSTPVKTLGLALSETSRDSKRVGYIYLSSKTITKLSMK